MTNSTDVLIGPNPCPECGGEYGDCEADCSRREKETTPPVDALGLSEEALALCHAIEKLSASVQQTAISIKASALHSRIVATVAEIAALRKVRVEAQIVNETGLVVNTKLRDALEAHDKEFPDAK